MGFFLNAKGAPANADLALPSHITASDADGNVLRSEDFADRNGPRFGGDDSAHLGQCLSVLFLIPKSTLLHRRNKWRGHLWR